MKNKTERTYSEHASGLERGVYTAYLVGENILFMTVTIGLMIFWTSIGISAAAAGLIMMLARLWDAINDPILGGIVQKTGETRFGLYKPWTFVASFLLPIVLILTFTTVGVSQGVNADGETINIASWGTVLWSTVAYVSFGMAYTLCDVPIFSLAMTMEPDVKKRTTLLMFGRLGSGIAGVVSTFLFFGVLGATGSFFLAALILGGISFVVMVPIFLAKERNIIKTSTPTTLKTMVSTVKDNEHMQKLIIGATMTLVFFTMFMGMVPYICSEYLVDANLTLVMTLGSTGTLLVTILLMVMLDKWGARKSLIITLTMAGIMIPIGMVATIATQNQWAFIILYVGAIFTTQPGMIVMMAKYTSECIEYGHYETENRQEAVGFAVQTFLAKFTMGIGGFILGLVVTLAGYESGLDAGLQAHSVGVALIWIFFVSSVIAIVMNVLGWLVIYNLRTKDVKIMAAVNKGIITKAQAEEELAKPYEERGLKNLVPEDRITSSK